MSDINSVTLTGRIGNIDELKQVGESSLLNFSLAVSDTWKDRDGNKQEHTNWVRCGLWGKRAEALVRYLEKGSKIGISGRLEIKTVEKDGAKVSYTSLRVENLAFLGDPKGKGGGNTSAPVPDPDPTNGADSLDPFGD